MNHDLPSRIGMRRRAQRLGLCLVTLGCAFVPAAFAAAQGCPQEAVQTAGAEYAQGLRDYRAGRVEAGYAGLLAAHGLCPEEASYRNDLIVAAVAAGHAGQALELGAPLARDTLPSYVLEALGRAARDVHDPDLAIRYFEAALATGDDVGVRVGRDLAWLDRGDAKRAQLDLRALAEGYPRRIDVLEALGLADEAQGEVSAALSTALRLLEIDPNHPGALALRYRMLVQSGAPQLATDLTPPQLVSPAQRGATLQAALALEYRWARDAPGSDRERAIGVDVVIADMRAAIADPKLDSAARAGIRRDLVAALAERERAAEAIAEYQGLLADGIAVPPYVTAAAVGAYLTRRQPERALAVFHTLPADYAPSFATRVNVFYALLESGRYDEAVAWADALVATTPRTQAPGAANLRSHNDDYVGALVVAALARAYTDRLAEAQARLVAILAVAPANRDAELALAETLGLRGWPRAGAAEARAVLAQNPEAAGPLPKLFADDLAMAEWTDAAGVLHAMTQRLPADDPVELRAQRDWQTHEMPEFSVDASLGRSYGGRPGVIDSTVEEYGYSPPIDADYRVFVHLNQSEGTPVQGDTYRHAVGAGVEYHTDDWLATGELLEIDHRGPAPQLSLTATPDDFWRYGVSYAYRTLDIPIAAVVVGVHADRTALNVEYRFSESRDVGGTLDHEDFSDGNSRSEALWFWRERWVTGPVYKFDTRIDLDASGNTRDATNYFNPKRDFTDTVTLQNQWLHLRRYDSALQSQFDVELGSYWQQNFSTGFVGVLRYQLAYDVNDRVSLKAGVSRTWRPYDGERERLDALTLNFLGRF